MYIISHIEILQLYSAKKTRLHVLSRHSALLWWICVHTLFIQKLRQPMRQEQLFRVKFASGHRSRSQVNPRRDHAKVAQSVQQIALSIEELAPHAQIILATARKVHLHTSLFPPFWNHFLWKKNKKHSSKNRIYSSSLRKSIWNRQLYLFLKHLYNLLAQNDS